MRKNIIDIADKENGNRGNQRGEGGLKGESAGRDYWNRRAFQWAMWETTAEIPRKNGRKVAGVREVEDTRRTWPKELVSAPSDSQQQK